MDPMEKQGCGAMPAVQTREATANDSAAIAAIYNESIVLGDSTMDQNAFRPEDIEHKLKQLSDREIVLVLERDGNVLGWGIVKEYSDRLGYRAACETSVYLKRDETGCGYGTVLQSALMERVREFEYHHVVTKIFASNHGSIEFHRRFGFEVVGTQREIGFVKGQWQDVTIMQCVLEDVAPYCPDWG